MLSSETLRNKYFKSSDHPYYKYENKILSVIKPECTILDAGCGRGAPVLKKFVDKAKVLIGVDLEEPDPDIGVIKYIKGNISSIDIADKTADIVISRAVLEHVNNPDAVFKEINRILKPGGRVIFLIPNLYDYVSIASRLIPNRFHKIIVSKTEGRKIDDVFPTFYKANSRRAIQKLCKENGFIINDFQYIGQYPSSFMFNPYLFFVATAYEKIISRFTLLEFLRGWILTELIKIEM